jgi:hypothetical protein
VGARQPAAGRRGQPPAVRSTLAASQGHPLPGRVPSIPRRHHRTSPIHRACALTLHIRTLTLTHTLTHTRTHTHAVGRQGGGVRLWRGRAIDPVDRGRRRCRRCGPGREFSALRASVAAEAAPRAPSLRRHRTPRPAAPAAGGATRLTSHLKTFLPIFFSNKCYLCKFLLSK